MSCIPSASDVNPWQNTHNVRPKWFFKQIFHLCPSHPFPNDFSTENAHFKGFIIRTCGCRGSFRRLTRPYEQPGTAMSARTLLGHKAIPLYESSTKKSNEKIWMIWRATKTSRQSRLSKTWRPSQRSTSETPASMAGILKGRWPSCGWHTQRTLAKVWPAFSKNDTDRILAGVLATTSSENDTDRILASVLREHRSWTERTVFWL
jgi:hypothetical protein